MSAGAVPSAGDVIPEQLRRADFFAALYDGCDGLIELRGLPSKAQAFVPFAPTTSADRFFQQHAIDNLYFGVASRRDRTSGALENCRHLPALFVDVDFKATSEADARQWLKAFPHPASSVIASGGGLHVSWFLREPLELPEASAEARSLLRRLALSVPGGDLSAAEPARVLRVPGTLNRKYTPPRPVVIEHLDPARRYNLDELADFLRAEPEAQLERAPRRLGGEPVLDGARNITLFAEARALRARDMSRSAVLAALLVRNDEACTPPLEAGEVREIVENAFRLVDRPDFAPRQDPPAPALAASLAPLGVGAGTFLAQTFPPSEAFVEGILSSDGTGWIGGEEKAGKSYYAVEEALCLALGLQVCGRFEVPQSRRVLFVEEEDPPRRMHARLRALLRGHQIDPDDAITQETLDRQLLVSVWEGVSLDDAAMLARLEATIATFKPAVCYLDVLRKLTVKDLNKADQAGALLAGLDGIRRRHGVIFRILHHYRKQQGFRTGRGSQEIGGSYVLGAWGECSLFFEPIGRKQGAVRVEVQVKDGPPVPAFRLRFESEGPTHAPAMVRLVAEPEEERQDSDEVVLQAVATLPKTDAVDGKPGVSRKAIAEALKRSEATVRRALKHHEDAGRVLVTGYATKKAALYGVNG